MRRMYPIGAAALALAGALTACTLIAGVETIPVLDAGGVATDASRRDTGGLIFPHDAGTDQAACTLEGGMPTSVAVCNACLSMYCCDLVVSAFVTPANLASASGYIDCADTCASADAGAPCAYGCVQSQPAGFEVVAPYYACSNYNCTGACPLLGFQDACLTCMQSNHPGDYHSCEVDPSCARAVSCFDSCAPDAGDCLSGCAAIEGGPSFNSQLKLELEECQCNSPASS